MIAVEGQYVGAIKHAAFDALSDPETRLAYCLSDLRFFSGDKSYLPKRAFSSAARLLGLPARHVRHIAAAARPPKTVEGQLARRARLGFSYGYFSPLSPDEFGFVYYARIARYPWIIKIGFSKSPIRRMGELSRETGLTHELLCVAVGSYYDETRHFLLRHRKHIKNEWFWDSSLPLESVPGFLNEGYSDEQWRVALSDVGRRSFIGGVSYGAACSLYQKTIQAAQ